MLQTHEEGRDTKAEQFLHTLFHLHLAYLVLRGRDSNLLTQNASFHPKRFSQPNVQRS